MKKHVFRFLLPGLFIVAFTGCTGTVTLESLLEEMTDRKNLTYFREIEYSHLHFSSYDRASV